jgi:hypothetical protein
MVEGIAFVFMFIVNFWSDDIFKLVGQSADTAKLAGTTDIT